MRVWAPDGAAAGFERTTIDLPAEDDGVLVATVLRKRSHEKSDKAFLYVHGFVDYFFHEHVANALIAAGWNFYALELRRYGRSLRGGNRPNYCTDLTQYDAEITAAIAMIVDEDHHSALTLYGHSTGGLVVSLYAHAGARRADIRAVVLNSPFFGFKVSRVEAIKLRLAVAIGRLFPWLSDPKAISPRYGESLHVSARGEWNFDLRWKPIAGFPAYFGWVRAIRLGHNRVQRGLAVQCPVLVLHSDQSGGGRVWNENFHSRDIVLDVAHMRQFSAGLGHHVQREEVPGAIHDVMLSREPVRQRALHGMLNWLQRLPSAADLAPAAQPNAISPTATPAAS
jgi:alpha-beta hydrolase superfamily lysophospholipase